MTKLSTSHPIVLFTTHAAAIPHLSTQVVLGIAAAAQVHCLITFDPDDFGYALDKACLIFITEGAAAAVAEAASALPGWSSGRFKRELDGIVLLTDEPGDNPWIQLSVRAALAAPTPLDESIRRELAIRARKFNDPPPF